MSVELCLDHPWDNFVPLWVRTRFFSTAKDLRLKQIISYHNLLCWKSRPNITQITFALGITNYLSPGGGRILEGFHGLHEERRDQVSPTVGTIENWLPMRAVHKNGILFSLARQGALWISFFPFVCFTEKKNIVYQFFVLLPNQCLLNCTYYCQVLVFSCRKMLGTASRSKNIHPELLESCTWWCGNRDLPAQRMLQVLPLKFLPV